MKRAMLLLSVVCVLVALTLSSCGSVKDCPAYSSNNTGQTTEIPS